MCLKNKYNYNHEFAVGLLVYLTYNDIIGIWNDNKVCSTELCVF